jgi:hypothetical protein
VYKGLPGSLFTFMRMPQVKDTMHHQHLCADIYMHTGERLRFPGGTEAIIFPVGKRYVCIGVVLAIAFVTSIPVG